MLSKWVHKLEGKPFLFNKVSQYSEARQAAEAK